MTISYLDGKIDRYEFASVHAVIVGPGNVRIAIANDDLTCKREELDKMLAAYSEATIKGLPIVLPPGFKIIGIAG